MIYLGNGLWSDASSSLSHGGTWRDHKYIAIKNGRYIYPDDLKRTKGTGKDPTKYAKRPDGRNPDEDDGLSWLKPVKDPMDDSKPEKDKTPKKPSKKPTTSSSTPKKEGKDWKDMIKNEDPVGEKPKKNPGKINEEKKKKEWNKIKNKPVLPDLNGVSVAEYVQRGKTSKNVKYVHPEKAQKALSNMGPSAAEKAQSHSSGKSKNVGAGSKNVSYKKAPYVTPNNPKFKNAMASQGPSAAEQAQRGMMKGSSKNVSSGSKNVQYSKQLTDNNKKYQDFVSNQGPSKAEKAQGPNRPKPVYIDKEKQAKATASLGPSSAELAKRKKKKKKNPFTSAKTWFETSIYPGKSGKVTVKK